MVRNNDLSNSNGNSESSDSFGLRLIKEGGSAANLGRLWLEAQAMILRAKKLDNAFASNDDRLEGRRLRKEAYEIMSECEEKYSALNRF